MLINSKYVLLFETTVKEAEQVELLIHSTDYVIQNEKDSITRIYYKYYSTFTEAIKDIAKMADNMTTANLQLLPRGRFGFHHLRIKINERFGYLYDVNSAFGLMLSEKLGIEATE
jgi:hypothetical protein